MKLKFDKKLIIIIDPTISNDPYDTYIRGL